MAGSPTYTADTKLDSTYGSNTELTGNITVANSSSTIRGKGTLFTSELKVDVSITFTNDAVSQSRSGFVVSLFVLLQHQQL